MTTATTNRFEGILEIAENVLVTGSAGLGTWLGTHSASDTITAVAATQGGKWLLALAVSLGSSTRVTKTLKVVRSKLPVIAAVDAAAAPASVQAATLPVIASAEQYLADVQAALAAGAAKVAPATYAQPIAPPGITLNGGIVQPSTTTASAGMPIA